MFNYCTPKELGDLKSETLPNGKFYTLEDGTKLPSVTTVLGAKKKEHILEWRRRVGEEEANRISAKATKRGTNVHSLCEDYLSNQPLRKTMPDALEMFHTLKGTLNRINNIHYQECALWSKKLGMAGRVDCIGEFDGVLSVIDFKTSARVKQRNDIFDYFWQTTAYALMYHEIVEIPVKQIVILMAVEDSSPLVFVEKTRDHIEGLVGAIKYYRTSHA